MRFRLVVLLSLLLSLLKPANAFNTSDQFELNGVLAGAYQCQDVSSTDDDDTSRGSLTFQPETSYQPTQIDQVFFKFGFGVGNGLNVVSPCVLSP